MIDRRQRMARFSGIAGRSWTVLSKMRGVKSVRLQRVLLGVAVLVFVVASIFAYRNLPPSRPSMRWSFIALAALLGVPATTVLNAWEYGLAGRLAGHRIAFGSALKVTLLASAANLLPVPGSFMVRMQALKALGSSYGRAAGSNAVVGLAWLGTTALLVGLLQIRGGTNRLGAILGLGGLIALAATYALVARGQGFDPRILMARLVLIESGFVAVATFRFFMVLTGLGFTVSVSQAIALTVAGVAASATGFFPGGLGIRELIAAGVSPLIGLPASVGLFATALDRVSGFVVLAALTLIFVTSPSGRSLLKSRPDGNA